MKKNISVDDDDIDAQLEEVERDEVIKMCAN